MSLVAVYLTDGDDRDGREHVPLLPSEVRAVLKQQNFMKADRLKEVLLQVQEMVVHSTPDFRDTLKVCVCVDNTAVVNVLTSDPYSLLDLH